MHSLCERLFNLPDYGIFRCTFKTGVILLANHGLTQIFETQCPEEELVGKKIVDYIDFDFDTKSIIDRLFKDGYYIDSDVNFTLKTGHKIWVSLDLTLVNPEHEDEKIVEGIIKDITKRKDRENELTLSEERFRTIFENTLIGLYRTTPDGKIILANPTLAKMLGYRSVDELLDRNLEDSDFYEPQYNRDNFIDRIEKEGEVVGLESTWKKKNGELLYVRENARAIRNNNDKTLYYEGSAEDITERKTAEKSLQKERRQLLSIFDSIDEPIYICDPNTYEVLYVNFAFKKQLGEVVGKKCYRALQNLDEPCSFCTNEKIFGDNLGKTYIWEFKNRKNSRWYRCIDKAIFWPDKRWVRCELAFDITDEKEYQNALKESRRKLATLIGNLPGIAYRCKNDKKWTMEFISEGSKRLTGYEPEDIIQNKRLSFADIIHPEDRNYVWEEIQNWVNKREPFKITYRIKDSIGKIKWVWEQGVGIYSEENELMALEGFITDITERVEAQQALRESETRFRTLMENSPSAIFTYKEKFLFVNQSTELLTGYSEKELQNMNFWELVHPDDREMVKQRGMRRLAGLNVTSHYQFKIIKKSGEVKWIDFAGMRFVYGGEDILMGTAFDITERKKALDNLAAEKEQLAVTLRSIGDGVITTDMDGNIMLINKIAETLTGWEEKDAIGKPLSEVFHIISEKTRKTCENPLDNIIKTDGIVGLANDTVLISRDGQEIAIADCGAPIHDRKSNMIGAVIVFRNVTEKRRLEEELAKSEKLESLGILAGGIAHDFNNILAAVVGNISLAKIYINPTDKLFALLDEAERASLSAKDLTYQLLTFSKGGSPLKKVTSLQQVIKNFAGFSVRGSNVKLVFDLPNDLWKVEVDKGQMSQVINNIVLNAKQSMPEGGIVEISARNILSKDFSKYPLIYNKYVMIEIQDQGCGIPKDDVTRIFDPYFTTKEYGSGLGLAICYSIIKKHAGHIAVESQVNQGSRFFLFLPVTDKPEEAEQETIKEVIPGKGRILVMDDETNVLQIALQMLRYLGYEAVGKKEGATTIDAYQKAKADGNPFDLVILDLTIKGGMGGLTTLERLKKLDPDIKAVVSSGYSTDPIMSSFRENGFLGVVAKPYRLAKLSNIVKSVLKPNERENNS